MNNFSMEAFVERFVNKQPKVNIDGLTIDIGAVLEHVQSAKEAALFFTPHVLDTAFNIYVPYSDLTKLKHETFIKSTLVRFYATLCSEIGREMANKEIVNVRKSTIAISKEVVGPFAAPENYESDEVSLNDVFGVMCVFYYAKNEEK